MPTKGKDIFRKVLWFENRLKFDIDYFDLLQPRREVSHHRRYRSGVFNSEKCGRDIQYESALELRFIERLESNPHVVFYWDQPVKIPYCRGRRKVYYTPDFGIYLDSGYVVLAEIKELSEMLDYSVQQKTEALMEFCDNRGFGLLLTDGRHTPKDLLKGRVNRRFENELLKALRGGTLREPECREIMHKCRATAAEMYKAVIRHNLRYRSFPRTLQQGNDNRIFRGVFFERQKYRKLICDNFSPDFE